MANRTNFIGTEIGSYRIIAEIDSGAFGAVYQGKHVIFDDEPIVAIKLLHAHLSSAEACEQFIQEARLLKKLKHPYILPILNAGIQDGMPYLVTEYTSGGSLSDRLKQQVGSPMSVDEALTIITQIGQALYYAHQQNVVHRDLKPGNILFNAKGEALLADFGIAVILATARTRDIGRGGTPAYMAPEQFEGKVSTKSDQYALGCIAYELLTGRQPFDVPNPTIEAMWFQHAKVNPIAPIQLNPRLPPHIVQVTLKAMAKERTGRHADVSVFIGTLQKPAQQCLAEGNDLYKAKRYEEALVACEQAIRLDPSYVLAYYNKGYVLHELKRYEEALVAYEQAIRLAPNNAGTYHNKGSVLRDLKWYKEALVAFEQAIRLDPNNAAAYHNQGYILHELKRYEEALVAYEQAIRLDLNNAAAYHNQGYVLEKLGRSAAARKFYKKARELGYNG